MSIIDDTLHRPGQLGDALYEGLGSTGLGSTGLGSTATSAGSRRSTVNPTTEAILAQRANRTAPLAGTQAASGVESQAGTQGQPPRQTRFSSTRTSIATPDRSNRTRDNSGTTGSRGTTGRSGENGISGRQAITAPIIAQSSTAAAPRATTAPAASVDDFLKGLMRDERYWKPGPDQAPYRDGIARLFQAAYPGPYTPGSFSRTAEPATSVQDLRALAGSFVPRQPERPPLPPEYDDFPTERPPEDILDRLPLRKNGLLYLLLKYYYPNGIPATVEDRLLTLTPGIPLANQPGLWPDQGIRSAAETTTVGHHEEDAVAGGAGNDTILETIPKTDQPSDDGTIRNGAGDDTIFTDAPANQPDPDRQTSIGHNGGPDATDLDLPHDPTGENTDAQNQSQDQDATPDWSYLRRKKGENYEDFEDRITQILGTYNQDPDFLLALEDAFLEGIQEEPDWFTRLQGVTAEELENLKPVEDPETIRGAVEAYANNGNLPLYGTSLDMTLIVGPDGTVYHRGTNGNVRNFGAHGTLSEIQNQYQGARARKGINDGDWGIASEIAMANGFIVGKGPGGNKRSQNATDQARNTGNKATASSKGTPTKPWYTALDINPDTGRRFSKTENPLTSDEFAKMPSSGKVDARRVRTIQDTATENFSDGHSIGETRDTYKSANADDIPPIRIFEKDGKIYTLDHRRLVAGRLADEEIRYQKATPEEIEAEIQTKLTTINDGMSIDVVPKRATNRRK